MDVQTHLFGNDLISKCIAKSCFVLFVTCCYFGEGLYKLLLAFVPIHVYVHTIKYVETKIQWTWQIIQEISFNPFPHNDTF